MAVMDRVVTLKILKESFSKEFEEVVQFRALEGRSVLITFQNHEVRDTLIKGPWMERWFEKVKPWQGEPASLERFAWLSCMGIPLNSWNAKTFKRIGEVWGSLVLIEEETLKNFSFAKGKILIATEESLRIERWIQMEVHGVRYEVLVKEESSCVYPEEIWNEGRPSQKSAVANKTVEMVQVEGGRFSETWRREVEDDDIEIFYRVQPMREMGLVLTVEGPGLQR